jgi:hypothetical protein
MDKGNEQITLEIKMHCHMNFEHNLLNIDQNKNCFDQKLSTKIKHILCPIHFPYKLLWFLIYLGKIELTTVNNRTDISKLLYCAYIAYVFEIVL